MLRMSLRCPLPGCHAVVADADRAIGLASGDSARRVDAYEADWQAVDRLRDRAERVGLSERVFARHIDALRFAGLRSLPACA